MKIERNDYVNEQYTEIWRELLSEVLSKTSLPIELFKWEIAGLDYNEYLINQEEEESEIGIHYLTLIDSTECKEFEINRVDYLLKNAPYRWGLLDVPTESLFDNGMQTKFNLDTDQVISLTDTLNELITRIEALQMSRPL